MSIKRYKTGYSASLEFAGRSDFMTRGTTSTFVRARARNRLLTFATSCA